MAAVTIRGAELHYDEVDRTGEDGAVGEQHVIVWGHGFLFAAELYHCLIDELPGYRHIALDFRGHGRSAAVIDDATISRMADDTWDLLAELGVDRFVYVGHSMGNAVGLRLVSRHPEAVAAAVGLAGVPLVGSPESCRPLNAAVAGLGGDQEAFTSALGQLFVHEGMDAVIKQSGAAAALVQHGPLISVTQTELFLDDSADILPGLTQPWLFLIPAEDAAIPADAQLAMAKAIPGARAVWLNGEGHIYPQERPAEAAAYIRTFLSTLPERSLAGSA